MTTLVVDASVAVRWTIQMPLSEEAEHLLRLKVPLIAPDLIIPEVTNAFYFHVREREDRVQRAPDGLEFLPRWFTELVPSATLRYRAMAYALELQHPAYDCFYLALAESRRGKLITTDQELLNKVRGTLDGRYIVHLADFHV